MEYLRTHLIGSHVELIEADEQKEEQKDGKNPKSIFVQPTYPIPQTNYSVGSYLKITKPNDVDVDVDVVLVDTSIFRDSVVYDTIQNIPNISKQKWWLKPFLSRQSFDDTYPLNCIFI